MLEYHTGSSKAAAGEEEQRREEGGKSSHNSDVVAVRQIVEVCLMLSIHGKWILTSVDYLQSTVKAGRRLDSAIPNVTFSKFLNVVGNWMCSIGEPRVFFGPYEMPPKSLCCSHRDQSQQYHSPLTCLALEASVSSRYRQTRHRISRISCWVGQ